MLRAINLSILILAALAAAYIAAPSAGADSGQNYAPPDSFLVYRAASVDALVSQIDTYPGIRKHYARHFGMRADCVGLYFRANLQIGRLASSGTFTVYGVDRTGQVYSRRQRLAKGILVFTTADGVPVLKADCGNPITKQLPSKRSTPNPLAVPPSPTPDEAGSAPPPETPDSIIMTGIPDDSMPVEPDEPTVAVLMTPVFEQPPAPPMPAAGPPVYPTLSPPPLGHDGFLPPFWYFVPKHGRSPEDPTPVPEPGAVTLLVAQVIPIVLVFRRRRRR